MNNRAIADNNNDVTVEDPEFENIFNFDKEEACYKASGGVRYQYYESSAQSYGVEEEERQQRVLQKQDCLQLKAKEINNTILFQKLISAEKNNPNCRLTTDCITQKLESAIKEKILTLEENQKEQQEFLKKFDARMKQQQEIANLNSDDKSRHIERVFNTCGLPSTTCSR